MKLLFVNLQFLPINNNVSELSSDEYKELLSLLIRIGDDGYLGRDKYMVFDDSSITVTDEFVKGEIIIFKKPPDYRDLSTNIVTTKPKENEVEYSKRARFYFYTKKHIFVIQKKTNELDRSLKIEKKLHKLFFNRFYIAKEKDHKYLNYALSINIISKKEDLEKVINNQNVKSIEIDITYPNSDDLEDALEDELKNKKTHRLQHIEKSYESSYMNGVTDYAKKLSHLALKLGNVIMRYIDEDNKMRKYVMKDKIIERDLSEKYKDENLFEDDFIRDEIISVLNEIKNENI